MHTPAKLGRTLAAVAAAAAALGVAATSDRESAPPAAGRAELAVAAPVAGERLTLVATARAMQYDAIAGDEQRLMVYDSASGTGRYGPLARIDPEVGTFGVPKAELAHGRFVARMVNLDAEPYPDLALGAYDTTYVWVDSVQTGEWRVLLVPASVAIPSRQYRLGMTMHEGHLWRQSSARWLSAGQGDKVWVSCVTFGCCWIDPH